MRSDAAARALTEFDIQINILATRRVAGLGRRSVWERLCARPFEKWKTVYHPEPTYIFVAPKTFIVHPALYDELVLMLGNGERPR